MNIIYCHDFRINNLLERSKDSFSKHNKNVEFFEITEDRENLLKDFTDDLLGYSHLTTACFYRLLIPKLFPELDRALYVDCDILCLDNIDELYNSDFENNYFMATKGHNYSIKQAQEMGLPYYINSGMLMFNIPLMNKENYFQQILDNWRDSLGKLEIYSADEAIINWVFHNKIKLVNEKWNYCHNRQYGNRTINENDIKMKHFIGKNKSDMLLYNYG